MNIKKLCNFKKSNKNIEINGKEEINGGVNMAVLAKGKPIMFSVKKELAKEFIEDSNKKVISNNLLDKWKKETEIFRKRK